MPDLVNPQSEFTAALLRSMLDESPEAFYVKDLDSRFVWVSQALADMFGRDRTEVIGTSDADYYTPEHAVQARADELEIMRTGLGMIDVVERETWPDREDTWAATTKLALRNSAGDIIGTWGLSRPVTDRVTAEQLLAERTSQLEALDRELRNLLDGSPDAMVRWDRELRHVYLNPAATTMFGENVDEVLGRTNREIGHPQDVDAWETAITEVLVTGESSEVEFTDVIYGEPRWFQARFVPEYGLGGTVTAVLAAIRDLTARKHAEEALEFQAVHDPLTGLANRVLLLDRVGQAIARLERNGGTVAVLFVDLDRFKAVNDRLGHAAGDWLLLCVAERLHAAVRPADTVARFGGDEFVVLCEGINDVEEIRQIAERIDVTLAAPFVHDGLDLHVTGSVGVGVTSDFEMDPERLVADADAAMYEAKQRGGARHHFHQALV